MKVRKEWIGSQEPATKGDLADLQEDLHVDMAGMEGRIANSVESSVKSHLEKQTEKILHEFRVTAENIHKDVAEANKDEISALKDKIEAIQRHVGLEAV